MTRVDGRRPLRRLLTVATAFVCAAAILAGCAPEPHRPARPTAVAAAVATPQPTATPTATTAPDPLQQPCPTRTTMSVWAHMDDDLLFLQSPIAREIAAGDCVRTVFVTAADDGHGFAYAHGREDGIEHAYDRMRGHDAPWRTTDVALATGAHIVVAQPEDDARITIVFFRLPDGNLSGHGFPSTGMVSLEELAAGRIPELRAITGAGSVTRATLIASLQELMVDFAPMQLFTTVPATAAAASRGDHPDHGIVGEFATAAWTAAGLPVAAITYAIGYQTMYLAANVSGAPLRAKEGVFQDYAAHDPRIHGCVSFEACLTVRHYGLWLQREYSLHDGDLAGYRAPAMPAYPLATPTAPAPPAPHR